LHSRDADIKPDRRVRVGIVGAGDIYPKFIRPTLDQRGTERFISDPFMCASLAGNLNALEHRVDNIRSMPDDLDYTLVTTPPYLHLEHITEILDQGKPAIIEKPIVGNLDDLNELEERLSKATIPVYCVDWTIEHAKPLLHAAFCKQNIQVPFHDTLIIHDPDNAFATFDITKVVAINARFVEGGDNPLADMKKTQTGRNWLYDFNRGGGILYDMAVHVLNPLAVLGYHQTQVHDVFLGKLTEKKGHYELFGKEPNAQKTGEMYGRAVIKMGIEGGRQDIHAVIEAGKGGSTNDGVIELIDEWGKALSWNMFPTSTLKMTDAHGEVIAKAQMHIDCYSLVFAHAAQHIKNSPTALYYPEQDATFRAIARMHLEGRHKRVNKHEIIRQLALEELS
ncbi:MAG: Gfo/Idh/MocA family oxidoreductase, partial [Alphaproteobacteria bacterium]|nr:Gfo/Idh/MocA family oxidoreductase [Alphaproteobacteria bacterium]